VPAEHERAGRRVLDAKGTRAFEEPRHRRAIEVPRASTAVGLGEASEEFEVDLLCQPPKRAVADGRR
jgi:hypothetical protein